MSANTQARLRSLIFLLIIIGIADAAYLAYKHYYEPLTICTVNIFGDCGTVLRSEYSVVWGIPLAVLGLLHYLGAALVFWSMNAIDKRWYGRIFFIQTASGIVVSVYLLYLQIYIIHSLCAYCLLSALISLFLYILARHLYHDEYRSFWLAKIELLYKLIGKPFFFLLPPEWVHERAMFWGEFLGKLSWKRWAFRRMFYFAHPALKQTVAGIGFDNPIGLSAGYDYTAAFMNILPSIGFGFETIGTISNESFTGNPPPRLGRLPKSKSLLVNKGFRNPGMDAIAKKMKGKRFAFPVGISIGRTNGSKDDTQKKAIADVVSAFQKGEKARLHHSYYELNISCPNLSGTVSFYPPQSLKELLTALNKLKISKPVFVKMPIEKTDEEVKKILAVIVQFKFIHGVIFGNLQKNRNDPSFDKKEIQQAGKGNFSGKPTVRRSNELIRLAYKEYGKRLVIIGCGGVFTAEDAYRKIRLGASLVQLITGMIFEGPQRIAQINRGLVDRLQEDGFKNIRGAVGVDSR